MTKRQKSKILFQKFAQKINSFLNIQFFLLILMIKGRVIYNKGSSLR